MRTCVLPVILLSCALPPEGGDPGTPPSGGCLTNHLSCGLGRLPDFGSFLGAAQAGQDAEIFERRGVAFDLGPGGDLFEQAAHDFA